jgi:hypothetical protein
VDCHRNIQWSRPQWAWCISGVEEGSLMVLLEDHSSSKYILYHQTAPQIYCQRSTDFLEQMPRQHLPSLCALSDCKITFQNTHPVAEEPQGWAGQPGHVLHFNATGKGLPVEAKKLTIKSSSLKHFCHTRLARICFRASQKQFRAQGYIIGRRLP